MAHVPDGVLSAPVLIAGGIIAAAGLAVALRRLDDTMIVRSAILSAVVFSVSLVSVPVGPSSVHVLLAGLLGIMLGSATFAAVLVTLILQALLFGFGGVTTLGVNNVNIALPGVVCAMALGPASRRNTAPVVRTVLAGTVGALSVLGTGAMIAGSLALSSSDYTPVATVLLATYLPLAFAEALVTAWHRHLPRACEARRPATVRPGMTRLAGLILLILLVPGRALAHRLKVFATVTGTTISGYAFFIDGGRPQGSSSVATDATGLEIASGLTDDDGRFRFERPPTATTDLTITVDTHDAHVAAVTLPAARLGGTPRPPASAMAAVAEQPPPPADADQVAQVEAAVQRQIAPVLERIEMLDARLRVVDSLSAIFLILGMAGAALWARSRRS